MPARPRTGTNTTRIVVGVTPGRPGTVVAAAARLAERLPAELVCAYVDPSRYTVVEQPDGTVLTMPIDPDLADEVVEEVDPAVADEVGRALAGSPVRWSIRALAGAPAAELARLADEVDAEMIVVGTREPGLRASIRAFFSGSIAVQLAHRQRRPVLVIPLDPVGVDGVLPWDAR